MKKTANQINEMTTTWGTFDLKEKQIYFWKIGECNLWMQKDNTELLIASIYEENFVHKSGSDMPEKLPWARYALKEESSTVELTPVMPDRPIVVKPEFSFYLTKSAVKNIFVRIPVWISVSVVGKTKTQLFEIPSVILSNTWFGDLAEGELCYWLSSGTRSQIKVDPTRPFMAICPLKLQNDVIENLLVEKLAVRTENSTLYMFNSQLWTDMITILYTGRNEISKVIFNGKPHKEISGATKISNPRKKQTKKLLAKTFVSFSDIHIFGMPNKG